MAVILYVLGVLLSINVLQLIGTILFAHSSLDRRMTENPTQPAGPAWKALYLVGGVATPLGLFRLARRPGA